MARVPIEGAERHRCGRRFDGFIDPAPVPAAGAVLPDTWQQADMEHPGSIGAGQRCCSYCGSMHPDDFFAAIEAGWEVEPTDKNYKSYVTEKLGGALQPVSGKHHKFYFQHLDTAQQQRFIELLNTGKMRLGYPGRFYALPFFISRG